MQISLTFKPDKELVIPFNYNYQLQSAIYSMLGSVGESDFWHNEGFGDMTNFKGFCFSGLNGKKNVDTENKKLIFKDNIYLEVRSHSFEFIDAFQRAIELHPFIKLYDTCLEIIGGTLSNTHFNPGILRFNATTPVVIHQSGDNGKTKYFTPEEDEYFIRICNNIVKKYETITNKEADDVQIRPIGDFKKRVTSYKDFYISGYTGIFEIKTSVHMAEFIFNTGLGEKNAQGFGFVELFDK